MITFHYLKTTYGYNIFEDIKELDYMSKRKTVLLNKKRFLQRCVNKNVVPKTMRPKLNLQFYDFEELLHNCGISIVRKSIKQIRREIGKVIENIENKKSILSSFLTPIDFNNFMQLLDQKQSNLNDKIKEQHIKKFNFLSNNCGKNSNETLNSRFVVNLSKKTFNKTETKVLSLGPKFEVMPQNISNNNFINTIERNIEKFDEKERDNVRKEISKVLLYSKKLKPNLNDNELKAIHKLKKDTSIRILLADKNAGTVVMNTEDYTEMMNKFLTNNVFRKIKSKNNLITKKKDEVKNLVKRLISEDKIPKNSIYKIIPNAPIQPRMYGLIKLHKHPIAIRPITSTVNSCTTKFGSFLKPIINNMIEFDHKFIKNSYNLNKKLKDIQLNKNDKMISLDVDSLYTSIPIEELFEELKQDLNDYQFDTCNEILKKEDIVQSINLVLSENYFTCNGEWFEQKDGLAMGVNLSPVLANFYMKKFFQKTETFLEKPKHLFIYVDDNLLIWNEETCGNFDTYLKKLNGLRPNNIKFKVEYEVNGKIPFLDLLLTRNELNIDFEIYRKPTNVNRFLNFKSNHCISSKIAVIDSLIRRSMLLKGRDFVKKTLVNNEYPMTLINSRLKILSNRALNGNNRLNTFDINKVISMPYIKGISEIIGKVIKKFGCCVTYCRVKNNLDSLLYNQKDKIENNLKNGVYVIKCESCTQIYVGETKRYLKDRISDHKRYVKNKNKDISPIAEHVIDSNHTIDFTNAKIIRSCDNCYERRIHEALIIRGYDETSLLNRDKGYHINNIWSTVIEKRA
jgi:hypothetical protein